MDQQGRNNQTESQEPLRDWQQETWMAPFPMHENPFDEPEDAPELRELRSEELNNRSGEFWEKQPTGYVFGGTAGQEAVGKQKGAQTESVKNVSRTGRQRSNMAAGNQKAEPSRKGRLFSVLLAAAAATALFLVLYYLVFTVRQVDVTGNRQVSAEEIIRRSGIRRGTPIFSLNREEIERGIEQNPNLKFRYMEKELPGTVTLAVQEREACCWMVWNGILYTMDKQRMVLYETEDLTVRPAELVQVDGLKVRSGARVGQRLVLESREQESVFTNLFLEMKVLSCTAMMESADLSNLNSLLLTTRDGYTVSLGTSQDIHAKLRSMLLTREELIRRKEYGGVINVSLPETPIYSPGSDL